MIKHIVMFRAKDVAEGVSKIENLAKMKVMLDGLPSIIDEIKYYEVALNQKQSERASDIVIISEFDSWESLDKYLSHPAHLLAAEFILKIRQESRSVDYEI